MSIASTPLLAAESVGRRDPGNRSRWLIRGVTLRLAPGTSVGVRGPSGAGKTILLRALAMLDPVDEGQVQWRGAVVSPPHVPAFRAQTMYLHQQCVCWEGTVRDNFQRPQRLAQHHQKPWCESQAIELLRVAGRDPSFMDKPAQGLSGGERQLVGVVRALLLDPTVLLLDEPTAALDENSTRAVEKLVAAWRSAEAERACVWVSHSAEQTRRVAERVLELE